MRILSAEDVRAAVSMKDAIDAVRAGFIALSTGKASVPLRTMLVIPTDQPPMIIASSPVVAGGCSIWTFATVGGGVC